MLDLISRDDFIGQTCVSQWLGLLHWLGSCRHFSDAVLRNVFVSILLNILLFADVDEYTTGTFMSQYFIGTYTHLPWYRKSQSVRTRPYGFILVVFRSGGNEAWRAEARVEFSRRSSKPSPPARGLRERCKLSHCMGLVGSPGRNWFRYVFNHV